MLSPDVPIIGQPFKIHTWSLVVLVQCTCGKGEPFLLQGTYGASAGCPACGRSFQLQVIQGQPGSAELGIGLGVKNAQGLLD